MASDFSFSGNIRAGGWQILDAYPGLQQFVRIFANRPNIKKYLQSEGQQTGKARLAFTRGPDTPEKPGVGADYLSKIFETAPPEL